MEEREVVVVIMLMMTTEKTIISRWEHGSANSTVTVRQNDERSVLMRSWDARVA